MDFSLRSVLLVYFSTVSQKVYGQITAPLETEHICFNGILAGSCPQNTGRAFVKQLIAGVKYTSRYTNTNASMCPYAWTSAVLPECCVKDDASDCYGEYNAVATDPYVFHAGCIGKNTCLSRAAPFMDSRYLNCNQSIYPAQTTYFYKEFYCINVDTIGNLANGKKENDGQGSLLYLWSGTSNYSSLAAEIYTCSVETDCNDTISVISLDFRFSEDNVNRTCINGNVNQTCINGIVNRTCIKGNMLTITDASVVQNFNCSTSNNNFTIQTLYTSTSNYITLKYTGATAGGYLWLALQSSSNGNLALNCLLPSQINNCDSPTSTEESTTTTGNQTSSTAITSVNNPIVQPSTDKSSTTTIIVIVVVILGVLVVIILSIIGYRKCKKNKTTKEEDSEIQNELNQQEQSPDTIRSPETDDPNNIINNSHEFQANGSPPITGICTNQDLGKFEVEEENNSEVKMIPGLLPPINHTLQRKTTQITDKAGLIPSMNHTSEDNRKKRKKKNKHKNKNKNKNKHEEEFIDDYEDHQQHNNDNEGKENESTDKIIENSENSNTEHEGKIGNGNGNGNATKFEHLKDVAGENMGEINNGHQEVPAFMNINNECKSDETRKKKKKKKRKKSKSSKVHAADDEREDTQFNEEVCKITSPSNEDDEHSQSHKTEIIKEK